MNIADDQGMQFGTALALARRGQVSANDWCEVEA